VQELAARIGREQGFAVSELAWPEELHDVHATHATIYTKSLSYYFKTEAKLSARISPVMNEMIAAGEAISVLPSRAVPRDLVRIGSEFGLPDLPSVELVIKVGPQASPTVMRLAASMSAAMRSRTGSLAEAQ
jgi:DNA-binding transcriptional LysR family regulator